MIHHVNVEVSDLERSGRFYDAVVGALGWRRHIEEPDDRSAGASSGPSCTHRRATREQPAAGTSASHRPGSLASRARGRPASPLEAPTTGPLGQRPEYGATYYSAYLLDPDGNRIEIAVGAH